MVAVIGLVSFQALDFPTDSAKAGYGCLSTNQDPRTSWRSITSELVLEAVFKHRCRESFYILETRDSTFREG